jgi:hypothetical protein
MIATHMFLKKYNKIHLFGFDWWDREEHHYMDKTRRGTLHNPKLEHSWFMNLEKEGKVQFL